MKKLAIGLLLLILFVFIIFLIGIFIEMIDYNSMMSQINSFYPPYASYSLLTY